MKPDQIVARLAEKLPQAITEVFLDDAHPRVHTTPEHWRELATLLYEDEALAFDWIGCLTAVDYVADNELAVVYELRSTTHEHWFCIKVICPREGKPQVPTVSDLWPGANWHEREAYDMMGITFTDHPDFRRILLPEDWVGFPLRKDYEFPREYHGIPNTYEMNWKQRADYPN